MGRERRRRVRRTNASPAGVMGIGEGTGDHGSGDQGSGHAAAGPGHQHAQVRSDRLLARESQTMISELKRVALVSGVCFGMLALLVVVERLQ